MAAPPHLPPFDPPGHSEAPPQDPESGEPLARNPLGWIALALVFVFLIVTGYARTEKRETVSASTASEEMALHIGIAMEDLSSKVAGKAYREQGMDGAKNLRDLADTLNDEHDARHTYVAAVVARELKRPVDLRSLAEASKDKSVGPARVALVTEDHPAKTVGLSGIKEPRFVDRIAAAQAAERAGIPRAQARQGLSDPTVFPRLGIATVALFGVGALGLSAWIGYFVNRKTPALLPRGEPSLPMSPAQADRFAWRAAGILLAYLVVSLGATLLLRGTGSNAGQIAEFAVLGGLAAYSLVMRGSCEAPMLSAQRMRGHGPTGRLVLWGVLAAAANLPLIFLIGAITAPFLKNAPIPTHPIQETLGPGASPIEVLATFLLAAVCAPIWEETFFRGLLFQGLRGLRWSVVASAALTSFLFASIHPQGLAAWFPLATIAAMSCALVHHTRSLIPSIVMHALWNTMVVVGMLIIAPLMT